MYLDEWGPIAWELFHYITYSYKPSLKNYYIIFFNTLYSILPCPHCSKDIGNILLEVENYPVAHIKNKKKITEWFTTIHNRVNIKTNNKNRFTIDDSNKKYLNNGDLTINHDRIFKFIKLALDSKLNENNTDFYRNIIALCHIYPSDINNSNIKLIKLCTSKLVNNKDWIDEFKNIDKKTDLINLSTINFNNLFVYSDRRIHLNKIILKKKHDNLNNNIITEKDGSIIITSHNNNNNAYHIRIYESLEKIDKLRIYIAGKTNNCDMKIKIKCGEKINEYNLHSSISVEYENISIGEKVSIFLTVTNKKSNNSCAIIDTLSLF